MMFKLHVYRALVSFLLLSLAAFGFAQTETNETAETTVPVASLTQSELATVTTVGNLVRIREGVEPAIGWQQVRPAQVGIVASSSGMTDDSTVIVNFPKQEGFTATASELAPVIGVGMIVQPGVDWADGNLHDDTQGVVEEIDDRGDFLLVKVRWGNNFTNRYFWSSDEYQVQAIDYGIHAKEMSPPPVFVSSKGFAEQLILGDLITESLLANGINAIRVPAFSSTADVRNALESAAIDIYPEYNGTGLSNFFLSRGVENLDKGITNNQNLSTIVVSALDDFVYDISWLCVTPGNNSYALAVRSNWAAENDIYDVQDLADFVNGGGSVTLASETEFLQRPDGLSTFEDTYGFKFGNLNALDQEQASFDAALAVRDAQSDVAVIYATDGTVSSFDLTVLADTLGAQPVYNLSPTVRQDALERYPGIKDALCPVFEGLDNFALSSMNARVSADGIEPSVVAKDYLCELSSSSDLTTTWFADDADSAAAWEASCVQ